MSDPRQAKQPLQDLLDAIIDGQHQLREDVERLQRRMSTLEAGLTLLSTKHDTLTLNTGRTDY